MGVGKKGPSLIEVASTTGKLATNSPALRSFADVSGCAAWIAAMWCGYLTTAISLGLHSSRRIVNQPFPGMV